MVELRRRFREEETRKLRAPIELAAAHAAALTAEAYGSEEDGGSDDGVVGMSEADALFAPFGALRL